MRMCAVFVWCLLYFFAGLFPAHAANVLFDNTASRLCYQHKELGSQQISWAGLAQRGDCPEDNPEKQCSQLGHQAPVDDVSCPLYSLATYNQSLQDLGTTWTYNHTGGYGDKLQWFFSLKGDDTCAPRGVGISMDTVGASFQAKETLESLSSLTFAAAVAVQKHAPEMCQHARIWVEAAFMYPGRRTDTVRVLLYGSSEFLPLVLETNFKSRGCLGDCSLLLNGTYVANSAGSSNHFIGEQRGKMATFDLYPYFTNPAYFPAPPSGMSWEDSVLKSISVVGVVYGGEFDFSIADIQLTK